MKVPHRGRNAIMKTITRTIGLTVATAAVLALTASAAQARPAGLNPTTGVQTSVPQPTTPALSLAPDRVDRIGVATQITPSQLPPDRVDQIGTTQQPTPSTPTVIVQTTGNSFDWLAAAIGAASVIVVMLLGAAALAARGRRHVTLSA
jgi:hypothetical protein